MDENGRALQRERCVCVCMRLRVRASEARKQMVTMAGVSRLVGGPISRLGGTTINQLAAAAASTSRRYYSTFELYCDGSQVAIIGTRLIYADLARVSFGEGNGG